MKDFDIPNPEEFISERVHLFKARLQRIVKHN